MNEAETRAELIDPMLRECGWGVDEDSRVLREFPITAGRIMPGGRGRRDIADYVLVYKGVKLAVIEAKRADLEVGEGVTQAKKYAAKLQLKYTFSTNGREIYQINMHTGEEALVDRYPTPEELAAVASRASATAANSAFETAKAALNWLEKFNQIPFEDKGGTWQPRYYQEIAVNQVLESIAHGRDRILLTLATGTGKTAIAFQIAWKLFYTRWNKSVGTDEYISRRPRILFLADRNILADQAFNSFSAFPEDAMVRISPGEIRKKGKVPKNGSIFFTIFQTFMSGASTNTAFESLRPQESSEDSMTSVIEVSSSVAEALEATDDEATDDEEPTIGTPYFGEYPQDYFDFIIIDECHRGGANDESSWREIMEYFSSAVQLGLTATPKRDFNTDTYRYFGEPVYIYSLKEGINDGFLTPFKVKRIKTTLDEYIYTSDDTVLEGVVQEGREYGEKDFNRSIEIKAREANRVKIYLDDANQKEKALIFGANQAHAALLRDLVNQYADSKDPFYCVRVTANDGEEGERQLREFQDNEKTIPTILTTSQKLSTGVDARNIRNIVLMRPVNSMIEFKQIVGRGTRLFDGKDFFTIYDYVGAYKHFSDPEWDGEPEVVEDTCQKCGMNPCICEVKPPQPCSKCGERPCVCDKEEAGTCEICGQEPCICRQKVKIKLGDGREREIQHMISTSFWSADGRPISAGEFLESLFGELPKLFKDENELRKLWGNPLTRKTLLDKLEEAGFPKSDLLTLQKLVDMEHSDLYDVLEYVFNSDYVAITREARAKAAEATIFAILNDNQKEFIRFVLNKYIESGVDELGQEKLPILLTNKYQSLEDAKEILGDVANIRKLFIEFQTHLYEQRTG